MAEHDSRGCIAARDALTQAGELALQLATLERRMDRDEIDRTRLGQRVTALDERLDQHETLQNQILQKLNAILSDIEETVSSLKKSVATVASTPVVNAGVAITESWRQTTTATKVKLTAAIVSVLVAPEVLKEFGRIILELLSRIVAR